jgi:alanyl-tRNA synthetase
MGKYYPELFETRTQIEKIIQMEEERLKTLFQRVWICLKKSLRI